MKLAGIAEIAELLGVSRERARQLSVSKGFPKPLDRLACGPIWKRSAVEKWAGEWQRKPGRPRAG